MLNKAVYMYTQQFTSNRHRQITIPPKHIMLLKLVHADLLIMTSCHIIDQCVASHKTDNICPECPLANALFCDLMKEINIINIMRRMTPWSNIYTYHCT